MSVYDQTMFSRLAQSTTLSLLAILVIGDGIWRANQQKVTKQVDMTALVRNVQDNIGNKSISPDVLVVGSSLSYCFTYPVEATAKLDAVTSEPIGNGSNCNSDPFTPKLLKKEHAPATNVFVMSMPGAMVSDVYNLVESSFANGKRPKTIVYAAAPRLLQLSHKPPRQGGFCVYEGRPRRNRCRCPVFAR
jgi:hypothetical protein